MKTGDGRIWVCQNDVPLRNGIDDLLGESL